MKKTTTPQDSSMKIKKVILELYLEIWYCYEDGKSMAYPLFTTTNYQEAETMCKKKKYEVVQVIDIELEDEEEQQDSSIGVLQDKSTGGKWLTEERNGKIFIESFFEPDENCPESRQVEICQLHGNEPVDKADAELICKAVNERQSLLDENEKVKRLLHDLTPGGSEFYNDPEYCTKWVRENREENHYSLAKIIKELKDERQKLLDSNRELLALVNECYGYFSAPNFTDRHGTAKRLKTAINNAKNI